MFGTHFYHERIRKSVATFGSMFNNLYVVRTGKTTGEVVSQMKVPLNYAPRSKYLDRIREQANLDTDTQVAVKLPRISFEMLGISYDPVRMLPKNNSYNKASTVGTKRNKFYSPVPYDLNFQLNIYAKTQDDALQIVEQIIPYFNPHYTLSIKPLVDYPEIKEDVPIILNGTSFIDDYEGAQESRRTIIYTLDFTMKVMFHGPTSEGAIIREAIADIHNLEDSSKIQKITVTPNPSDAEPEDDFGFTTQIDWPYDDNA